MSTPPGMQLSSLAKEGEGPEKMPSTVEERTPKLSNDGQDVMAPAPAPASAAAPPILVGMEISIKGVDHEVEKTTTSGSEPNLRDEALSIAQLAEPIPGPATSKPKRKKNAIGIRELLSLQIQLPMGRSRGNFHSLDEDPTQRSRRRKNASAGENLDSSSSGQGPLEGKRALYHCNYCNKDLTGKTRIKCAVCPDFDLCVECFSVGAEVTPHKSNHPYRVMDNLSFPLICPDWNADDEMLLLEGIEMYGLGNWAEVAEHVGTKSKEKCIDHYTNVYMNSPFFPLPDMSHVVGKNRKELLAMAKGHAEDKKGSSILGEHPVKEESLFSPSRVKVEGSSSGRLLSALTAASDVDSGSGVRSSNSSAASAAVKNASNMAQIKDGNVKMEDPPIDRNFGSKKPNSSGNDGSSLVELSGYNPKRQEFDPEYDNDAEQLLADMEFKETDTEEERELKLRVLRIYSKRLDERERRKKFILERNLLYPNPFEKDLSPEERALCRRYDVYMRFHSKEEHEELLQVVIEEHRTLKRLQELKEAQAAGCRTSSEANRYLEQKRKREAEENSHSAKDGAQGGASGQGAPNSFMASESVGKDSNSRPTAQASSSSYANDLDIMGFAETQLLSENEKRLCSEIRIPPPIYLRMQQIMTEEIFSGNVSKKADAHRLFKLEPSKTDRVYDMLVKKGIAPP